ncbi:MAG: sensor histidine kinase [Flavobacteriales bacterium]
MNKFWKKHNQWIGFNDVPFILLGAPFISVIVTMIFFGYNISEAIECVGMNLVPSYLSTLIFWLGDRQITIWFRKKFQAPDQWKKRIYLQSITILAYTAVMSIPLLQAKPFFHHPETAILPHPGFLKSFVACLFATIPICAIYEAAYFISRWKLSVAEAEKLKQQNTESQLEALKNQVNPHFLFNSLNTLVSLISDEPKAAVDFVHRLSHVYRAILDLKEKQVVTLNEELELLDNYNFLLKSRFGENLHFEIRLDDPCTSCYLVPLSLQILVENAIKHNVASAKRPLHIMIYNEGYNRIVVRNNLQPKQQKQESTGTGLLNIQNRFMLTFGMNIEVKETTEDFSVVLPLIPIEEYQSPSKSKES